MNDSQHRAGPSERIAQTIREIRLLPKEVSRFTLYAAIEPKEGHRWQTTVVDRGRGGDSRFYAIQTPDGKLPSWAPRECSYCCPDEEGLLAILGMFRDHPELWSKDLGDALDEPDVEPYAEEGE